MSPGSPDTGVAPPMSVCSQQWGQEREVRGDTLSRRGDSCEQCAGDRGGDTAGGVTHKGDGSCEHGLSCAASWEPGPGGTSGCKGSPGRGENARGAPQRAAEGRGGFTRSGDREQDLVLNQARLGDGSRPWAEPREMLTQGNAQRWKK